MASGKEKGARTFSHLSFSDRLKIEGWERTKTPRKEQAAALGVDLSTIYRELKRGEYTRLNTDYTTAKCYSPDIADQHYRENMRAKGAPIKLGNDHEFARFVAKKIKEEKYSPGAVLGEIRRKGLSFRTHISKPTLYRYIDQQVFGKITNADLPVKGGKRKDKPKQSRPARPPRGDSIEKRPAEVDRRTTIGDWEMDCVEGKKGTKKTLLVLTERKTRMELIRVMKDKTAQSVVEKLDRIEEEMGAETFRKVFRTITVDNGSEFSDSEGLERSALSEGRRTKLYFCHPYRASERGSNENQNRMIRRHFPKGTDFTDVTQEEIDRVEAWMNGYPRRIFDYRTAGELYEEHVAALT